MKRPLFLLLSLCGCPGLVCSEKESESSSQAVVTSLEDPSSYRRLFYSPELYEYDPFTFDPSNSMGSPYGGFARATMSRLAALPLRLVGSYTPLFSDSSFLPVVDPESPKGPYFSMYDAQGRMLACRIYDEEELTAESITQGMLDVAMEVQSNPVDAESSRLDAGHPSSATSTSQTQVDRQPNTIHNLEIRAQLDKLKGVCSQINTGYWNYQWCHELNLLQFHTMRDLTLVGLYDDTARRIMARTQSSRHVPDSYALHEKESTITGQSHDDTESAAVVHSGQVLVEDSFVQGDYCSAAHKVRSATVTLRCCKLDEWMSVIGPLDYGEDLAHFFDDDNHGRSVMAQIINLQEETTCSYTVVVCTNVLCRKSFQTYTQESKQGHGSSSDPENTRKVFPIHRFQKDDSIRQILQQTLRQCLTTQSGWWTYSFCYGQKITQFHIDLQLDPTLGQGTFSINAEKQSEHILGLYNAKVMNAWTKEDEMNHVVFPQGIDLNPTSPSSTLGNIHNLGKSPAFPDGNGAYYVEEYTDGDVCNQEDVTGAAIKGGSATQGGIPRSSSVRFSCGKELKLLRIYEDSTCKYVLDVTVPELCFHPLFEAQSVQSQVVKCLPV